MRKFLFIIPVLVGVAACGARDVRQDFIDLCSQAKPGTDQVCPDLRAVSWSEASTTGAGTLSKTSPHTLNIQLNRPLVQLDSWNDSPVSDPHISTFEVQDRVLSVCMKQVGKKDVCVPAERISTTRSKAVGEMSVTGSSVRFTDTAGADSVKVFLYPQDIQVFDVSGKVQLELTVKDWKDEMRISVLDVGLVP